MTHKELLQAVLDHLRNIPSAQRRAHLNLDTFRGTVAAIASPLNMTLTHQARIEIYGRVANWITETQ